MRQLTIVIPYLVSDPEQESALQLLPPGLSRVVEKGTVVKLDPVEESMTPEAAWLALNPAEIQVSQGPLTVSALGHHPPARSVHFHLSLCNVDLAGDLQLVDERPTIVEIDQVFREVERLATRKLTPLVGEGVDHAMVIEDGSLEMSTVSINKAVGSPMEKQLPQGESEKVLRRFIDDCVNILEPLEINHVRREEGKRSLNCLWPWGQGFVPDLPNLPIRRGDIVYVESGSMRMKGLCDLVGYRHGDRALFGTGLRTDYGRILRIVKKQRLSLAVLDSIEEMQRHNKVDEINWNLVQLSEKVIEPLMENEAENPFVLRLVAPGGHASLSSAPERANKAGLALKYDSRAAVENQIPFDERVLDDPRLPVHKAWEFIHPALIGAY